jgi:hypothetical protein
MMHQIKVISDELWHAIIVSNEVMRGRKNLWVKKSLVNETNFELKKTSDKNI